MSRQDDDRRRVIVKAIIGAFIDHPKWRNDWIAEEIGVELALVEDVRGFALSYPPTAGVETEPSTSDAQH